MEDRVVEVLVVDDDDAMRWGVKVAARRLGCSVVGEASDGAAGVELARVFDPNLVVLDMQMPVMDGLEALTALKRCCPAAVVVMFSSDPTAREKAMALGVDGWCDKEEGFAAPLQKGLDVLSGRRR